MFRPRSLQQRFTWFMIVPVTLLLIGMGIAGFLYARDLLLDQWREAAILKLQRAAHEADMRKRGAQQRVHLHSQMFILRLLLGQKRAQALGVG